MIKGIKYRIILSVTLITGAALSGQLGMSAYALVYYVCDNQAGADADCVAGDDANAGTNPDAPWQTYARAQSQFGSLQAGDQILFARGGSFQVSSARWVNFNSRAANPIVIADYAPPWASGDEARPILTNLTDGVFRFEDGGNADHDEGYVIRNLELRGGNNGWAFFLYNDVDDVSMENLLIDGFVIGVHCAGANEPNPGADQSNDRITLQNSRIVNNSGQGWLGGGKDILIENNEFENNGFAQAIFNHNIYVSDSQNVIIRNNDLYRSAIVDSIAQGVSLVVHGVVQGLVIEGNRVREDIGAAGPGCWGIAVDTGYGSPEDFRGTVIRGNKVINVGNLGIGVASGPDCIIENNVIIQEQPGFGFTGIAVPDRTRGVDDTPDDNATVRNNSIYINSPASGSVGIRVNTEGAGHLVVGNVIVYMGNSSNWSCFNTTGLTSDAFEAFDYNLCYFPNAPEGRWEVTAGSLENWRIANGFDTHSLNADPLYVAPGACNLALSPGSPAINASHPILSAVLDITGRKRYPPPDIGAYEFVPAGFCRAVDQIIAYPNPCKLSVNPMLYFLNLPDQSTIRIYNLSGELVSKLENVAIQTGWNVSKIAPGVYFYMVKYPGGKQKGKVCVVK